MVLRVTQENVDPRLGSVVRRHVVVEQQLAEQDADADIREGPKREESVRRVDEPVDLGVFRLDLSHERPDRLIDQRKPDLLEVGHRHRIIRLRLGAPRAPDDLTGDENEHDGEEASQRSIRKRLGESDSTLGGDRRGDPDDDGESPANVAVPLLPPSPHKNGREDGKE